MQEIHMLRALIDTDFRPFLDGMRKSVNATKDLRDAWVTAAKDIARAGERMTMAVAGMAASVATSFANFEQTITRAGAVTRTLGTKDFDRLKEAAREMGRTTQFSATEAAEAIEQMGLAGLKTEEILAALPGALQLAAAAGVEISQAADVAAKTMRAFGADAAELTHINDVLVGTFTRSNTDLGQLAEAMKQVAPVSKSMGVSLEQTATIIAKMSDAGFQGSMAGTALRNIIMRLSGATPEATAKLNDLGIQTQDANGKMRDLFDIIGDIQAAGLGEADLLNIFGARGGPQLLAVLEAGIDGLREFEEELTSLDGIAKSISESMLNTLSGAFKIILSQISDLQLEAGDRLRPAFEELAKSVTEFIDANKTEIVNQMVDMIGLLTDGLTNLMVYLKENGSALIELARHIGYVVARFAEFIAQQPKLMAFLIAFKVAGILGITQALGSLAGAIRETIRHFGLFGTAASGAQKSVVSLNSIVTGLFSSTGGFGLLLAAGTTGGLAVLDYFGLLGEKAGDAEEQIRKLNQTMQRGIDIENANLQEAMEDAAKSDDPIQSQLDIVTGAQKRFSEDFNTKQRTQDRIDNIGSGQFFLTPAQRAERKSYQDQLKLFDAQLQARTEMVKQTEVALLDMIIKQFTDLVGEVEASDLPAEHAREMRDQFTELGRNFFDGVVTIQEFTAGFQSILSTAKIRLDAVKREAESVAEDPEIAARKRGKAVDEQIEAIARQNRIAGAEGFDTVRGLVGDGQNLDAAALSRIAGTAGAVDSAFGEVVADQFVKDFQRLQDAGEITAEAIDEVVLTFLERLQRARETLENDEKRASELTDTVAAAQQQAIDRRTPGASRFTQFFALADSAGASDGQVRDFLGAQEGADAGIVNRFAGQFQDARGNPAQFAEIAERFARAINSAAEATQTAESATDSFRSSLEGMRGTMPTEWIQRASQAFRQLRGRLLDGSITTEEFRRQLARLQDGFSNAAQRASQILQQLNEAAFNAMFGGGFRSGGIPRMPGVPNGVQVLPDMFEAFGVSVTDAGNQFRDSILETVEPVQAIFDALNPGGIPFVQTTGFATVDDPAKAQTSEQARYTVNVQQLNDTEISRAFDRFEFERRRRGM